MSEEFTQGYIGGLVRAQEICLARAASARAAADREHNLDLREAYADAAWVYSLAADYIRQEWQKVRDADS